MNSLTELFDGSGSRGHIPDPCGMCWEAEGPSSHLTWDSLTLQDLEGLQA